MRVLDKARPCSRGYNCRRATDRAAICLHAGQTIPIDDQRLDVRSSENLDAEVVDAVGERAQESTILDLNVSREKQCAQS